ncbi:hypothetical protein AV654_23870 [Paenibacillus elgii]|uniref:S-layer protein n=1 Tax=Paenibacillus elgii TaxID=189691 RepID=A0A161RXC8_9BACL|nr:S-layer homology domain-containing protein [Paenibacillus elgii]KZE76199.1 hypothetical protein AV654_23870 [Paenibacillus elgii]
MRHNRFLRKWSIILLWIMLLEAVIPAYGSSAAEAAREPAVQDTGAAGKEVLPDWSAKEIAALRAEGIVQGFEDGTFRPGQEVTRAEFVTMLNRATAGLRQETNTAVAAFPDVTNEWFAGEVNQAARQGIVQGDSAGLFRPGDWVNRQEAAVMIGRTLNVQAKGTLTFADRGQLPNWAAPAVSALAEAGMLDGYPDGTFRGTSFMTRAEAAVVLYKCRMELKSRSKPNQPGESQAAPLAIQTRTAADSPWGGAYVIVHKKGERSILQWGRSDSDGKLSFELPYGDYEITAQKNNEVAYAAASYDKGSGGLTLKGETGGTWTGQITDKSGNPAAGIVLAFTAKQTFFAITDAKGRFQASVPPGTDYQLSLIVDEALREQARKETAAEAFVHSSRIPACLKNWDANASKSGGSECEIVKLSRVFQAPKAGETQDVGTISLSDVNGWGSGSSSGGGGGSSGSEQPDRTPPAVPTGLTAAADLTSVKLSWNAVSDKDLARYNVYMSANSGQTWDSAFYVTSAAPSTVTSVTYTVTGLTYGKEYAFAVSAVDTSGNESVKSAVVKATTKTPPDDGGGKDMTPPAIPAGLTAVAGLTSVELSWNAVSDTDLAGYGVYMSENGGQTWNRPLPVSPTARLGLTEMRYTVTGLTYGKEYAFAVTAVDTSGNESAKSVVVKATTKTLPDDGGGKDRTPPAVPTGLTATAGIGSVELSWSAVRDKDLARYGVYMSDNGGQAWDRPVYVNPTVSGVTYTVTGLTYGKEYTFAVTALDTSGNESEKSLPVSATVLSPEDGSLPPDPSKVATKIPANGAYDFSTINDFLYKGANPIQTGVAPGAIQPERLSVLRGKVLGTDGKPLPGAEITIAGHSEFGRTLSRADGAFDLAVNGGSVLTVQYQKDGYMTVQRKANALWADYTTLPEVVLNRYDTKVTEISLHDTTSYQVARGTTTADDDGSRTATLLFPPGTTGYLKLADGTTEALSSIHVRATEYTVGKQGERSMPGELPHLVGYTYAVELSADEAVAKNATEVRFNGPLYSYVDNFLEFPVGEAVPAGYYDRQQGAWIPSDNGKVIQILAADENGALIDSDGDGQADDEAALAKIGLKREERKTLAGLYAPGQSLWRVPIEHFTPWDYNWPVGPPMDAIIPPEEGPQKNNIEDPCQQSGSVIGCQEQTLGERIPIAGTSLSLNYYSKRTPGYRMASSLTIPLSDSNIPSSLVRIGVQIEIAGRTFYKEYAPLPNQKDTFYWDGKDVYGRMLTGSKFYKVTVSYFYIPVYYPAYADFKQSFGRLRGKGLSMGERRSVNIRTSWDWSGYLESPQRSAESLGIEGWDLDVHHDLDHKSDTIHFGYGADKQLSKGGKVQQLFFRGDASGQNATLDGKYSLVYYKALPSDLLADHATVSDYAFINNNRPFASGPDGSFYFATYRYDLQDANQHDKYEIFQLKRDGTVHKMALNDILPYFDELAVDADGALYAIGSQYGRHSSGVSQIRKFTPGASSSTVVAGTGVTGELAGEIQDGAKATDIPLFQPKRLQIGPDGSKYFLDAGKIYKIGPDGLMSSLGKRDDRDKTGSRKFTGVDSGSLDRDNLGYIVDLVVAPDGALYVLDEGGCTWTVKCMTSRIRKISPDGTITKVAGRLLIPGESSSDPQSASTRATDHAFRVKDQSIKMDRRGNIYFMMEGELKLYRISPDGQLELYYSDAIDMIHEQIKEAGYEFPREKDVTLLSVEPDGAVVLLFKTNGGNSPFQGDMFMIFRLQGDEGIRVVPSPDGTEAYEFERRTGKHLRTLNAYSGGAVQTFNYDKQDRLVSITDSYGNQVTVERDEQGNPTSIVAPGGQRTVLKVDNGRLTAVTNPGGETFSMAYDDRGLLQRFTDPDSLVRTYAYDAAGLLTRAENPLQGVSELSRTEGKNGFAVRFSKDGLTTTYEVRKENGVLVREQTDPRGAKTTFRMSVDGKEQQIAYPDGSQVIKKLTEDPRWGMDVPVLSSLTYRTPKGLGPTLTETRSVVKQSRTSDNKFDNKSLTVKYKTGWTESKVEYDAAQKTFTETNNMGHKVVTYMDAHDRVIKIEEPGQEIAPYLLTYDDKGKLIRTQQGNQFVIYRYDAQYRLTETEDASGQIKAYGYDASGRLSSVQLPGRGVYRLEFDSRGNLETVTAPGGSVYRQTFNGLDQLTGFAPDGAAGKLALSYTSGGRLDHALLPSGRLVSYGFDEGGRFSGLNDSELLRRFTYADATDRVASMETVASEAFGGAKQKIDYTYDGQNVRSAIFSGKSNGTFYYSYDGMADLSNIQFNAVWKGAGGTKTLDNMIRLGWDLEGNLSLSGLFSFVRNGPNKRLSSIQDGTLTVDRTYDELGRVHTLTYKIKDAEVYQAAYSYDLAGRIAAKTVTTPEGTETTSYEWDADGQLLSVLRQEPGGSKHTEAYTYDANRNRTSAKTNDAPAIPSVYGAYNELQQVGSTAYKFNEDGQLTHKNNDAYRYGTKGELLEAVVEGQTIRYTYDGIGRRTAREDRAGVTQYFYGNPLAPLQITTSINPTGDLTTYYYDEDGLLLGIELNDAVYYVITDAVGTPQRVLDKSGKTVKELKFNSYGVLLSDSNAEFGLEIGFAGGIQDAASKLVRFGYRDYDPAAGQWTAKDPLLFEGGQGNLYAYVNNNPVQLRDPCGLFCIGATSYSGIGGGGKVCIDENGASACLEAGVGLGGGVEVNPNEGISKSEVSVEAAVKVGAGPASISLGAKAGRELGSDCYEAKPIVKADLGPYKFDLTDPSKDGNKPSKKIGDYFKDAKMKAEISAKAKACGSMRW